MFIKDLGPQELTRISQIQEVFNHEGQCFAIFIGISSMEKVLFGDNLPGYEIGDKSAPAVIVIQEWWGITGIIKGQAMDIYSKGGYRCLIPDLYKGKIGVDKEEASHLMGNLDFQTAVEEIKQGVDYLKGTGSPKVACIGYCMGGALTFAAAQHTNVDAAIPFYGIPQPGICVPSEIKVPIQAHFGLLDSLKGFSDPETAKSVEKAMKDAGCDCRFFYYEGAGHGFMNANYGEEAVQKLNSMNFPIPPQDALDSAWQRVMEFLQKHLKGQTI
eukprot:TRINITY_DN4542_c0_g1_i7.p1 TRINITY_DN4542_c0_g1~~TRINITY_DN4542_c0_g1_i7.p1  ORF type:complete len:272 (+),score=31.20 TRINITY_DN4542_c0_g1_i7:44-859(+)